MRKTHRMDIGDELAALFHRDLTRLAQQLPAFTDQDAIWQCPPGVTNSAGNLILHLEGNLREYVGRLLGGFPYHRSRDEEFAAYGIPVIELAARIDDVRCLVPSVVGQLSDAQMQATFPEDLLGSPVSTQQFLIHLHGHLNYHLGQIDYLRRVLIRGTAVQYTQM
jgi:DinB superfamily